MSIGPADDLPPARCTKDHANRERAFCPRCTEGELGILQRIRRSRQEMGLPRTAYGCPVRIAIETPAVFGRSDDGGRTHWS
jgi:hypothetical protein